VIISNEKDEVRVELRQRENVGHSDKGYEDKE